MFVHKVECTLKSIHLTQQTVSCRYTFFSCASLKYFMDTKHSSLHLGLNYARIFVLKHYRFPVPHGFRELCSGENCSLYGQTSEPIFAPNEGYCLYNFELMFITQHETIKILRQIFFKIDAFRSRHF